MALSTLNKEKPGSGATHARTLQNSSRAAPNAENAIPNGTQDSKAYADIRVKMGGHKSPDISAKKDAWDDKVSIPSQISEDMWGELPKYQAKLHLDQVKKAKEELKRKKQLIKTTLDSQLKEQLDQKQRDLEAAKAIDRQMLIRAQNELDEEKRKKDKLRQRTMEQKGQRDVMLREALAQKEQQFK